jgi:signal transduction histidine kinase
LEGGRYKRAEEELDFSALINSCVDDFRRRFPEVTFHSHIQPELEITGDSLLLEIMINNLLENAVKYSPKQSIIQISLAKTARGATLSISDQGIGIPEKERDLIFHKFYRIGNEETRTAKGTGLGLYLCRKIATDHNADIEVAGNSPSGSNFTVTFHQMN